MMNFNLKNTYFFDGVRLDIKRKMGVVSHICIQINNRSKNVYIILPLACL
jgi:hypothetical protein